MFIGQLLEFALAEIRSLVSLFCPVTSLETLFQHELDASLYRDTPFLLTSDKFKHFPFVYLELPNLEVADQILQRSMMCKCFLRVVSQGADYESLLLDID